MSLYGVVFGVRFGVVITALVARPLISADARIRTEQYLLPIRSMP